MIQLSGPLRYLIGADRDPTGKAGCVTEYGYDVTASVRENGQSIKYGNMFFEKWADEPAQREWYAPYLHDSDTARKYQEGQIDPKGPGWLRNIDDQIARAKGQGFTIMEWDNPDAYGAQVSISVLTRAWETAGLFAVAKNPGLIEDDNIGYIAHPAVCGIIVERGAGAVSQMHGYRRAAGKPTLPIWFIAFGEDGGYDWAVSKAGIIRDNGFVAMGVTYSRGEYNESVDILVPKEVP
jgi:hypothetical protein